MRKNNKKLEALLLVALPLLVQIILSRLDELMYFRVMAFVMPIFICCVFVYYLSRYKLREGSVNDILVLVFGTYGLAFIHYHMQEAFFHDYALANDLPLDLDGFAPLIMAFIVHAFIYMALGIIIIAIFIFIKVVQHIFGTHEEVAPTLESNMMDWSVWDDTDKDTK